MMKKASIIFIVISLFTTSSSARQQIHPDLTLVIHRDGRVSAIAKFPPSNNVQIPALYLVAFPFHLDDNTHIEASNDIHIRALSKGNNYTLLALIQLAHVEEILFKLSPVFEIIGSHLDRQSLEFDFTYPYMSLRDKMLCRNERCFSSYNVSLIFPEEVSPRQISNNPNAWKRVDAQKYFISQLEIVALKEKKEKVWIAFPEFNKMSSLVANAFITIFVTILGLLASPFILRNRSRLDKVLLLVLSIAAFSGNVYMIYLFRNRIDNVIWFIRGGGVILISLYFIVHIIYDFSRRGTSGGISGTSVTF